MKSATFAALRLVIFTAICFLVAGRAFAQTTTNYTIPATSCQTYAAEHNCEFTVATPAGEAIIGYSPVYNTRLNVVEFYEALAPLGIATVDTLTTSAPVTVSQTGTPNRQGYLAVRLYSELTTFHGTGYTGSTSMIYTTTTRCCSSGRGASQHTTWAINSGSVTVTQ